MNGNGNPTEQSEERKGTDGSDPELEALRREAEEHRDRYLRVAAELDNFRKRTAREIEGARKFGAEKLAQGILPVRDSLEAGIAAGMQVLHRPVGEDKTDEFLAAFLNYFGT